MVKISLEERFYAEHEENILNWIRYLQFNCGEMARMREEFPDDWEIEELTRWLIFELTWAIQQFAKEVGYARAARKEFAGIRRRG